MIAFIVAAWLLKRAFLPQPVSILIIVALEIITFSIIPASRARGAIYTASFGDPCSPRVSIPFCAWPTSTVRGMAGTAFAQGLQSSVGQLGGVIEPQIFRSKLAAHDDRTSYAICVRALGGCFLFSCLSWYQTRNMEWDIHRIRHQRIEAEKESRLFTQDEVKCFDERKRFTKGLEKSEVVDALKASTRRRRLE